MRNRPQHLLTKAARDYRVVFVEEPVLTQGQPDSPPHMRMRIEAGGITVLTPVLDATADAVLAQRALVAHLHGQLGGSRIVHWYDTPMALRFTRDLDCDLCVYDCVDDLSDFRFAPAERVALEGELLQRADLVFTGGQSLSVAKRQRHADVHCFPGSVDVVHFARARARTDDPADQAAIPVPRIGFVGVIDERIDLALIAGAAAALPQVQFVMIGPVAGISLDDLPRAANIHWLGPRSYDSLPAYMSSWQAAWMPFALNDATRFLSPAQTPEYLAAGLRVTSTAVADVVQTYGTPGLVMIADATTLAGTLKTSLGTAPEGWPEAVDRHLARLSWACTWDAMHALMQQHLRTNQPRHAGHEA